MKYRYQTLFLALLACAPVLSGWGVSQAAESHALPNPLSLEYALGLVDEMSPSLQISSAARQAAAAQIDQVKAATGINVSIEGYARYIDPAGIAYDQDEYDEKLSLMVRKNLYDFGRSASAQRAAGAVQKGAELRYADARALQRLKIMSAYFDVMRADLAFARDNEALAVAYVSLDKLRNRHELGQLPDIELLEMESEYQAVRSRQIQSAAQQRATRSRLAIALNRPGNLPADLARPSLQHTKRPIPEYQILLGKALESNPVLLSLKADIEGAMHRMQQAQAGNSPRINAEIEASHYSREMGSADPLRAGIVFSMPLYSGGQVDADVAREQAEVYRLQGRLREAEDDVRQRLLDLWLELDTLRVKRDEVRALQDYRDLYLERSRAKYEMELQTDLGDAMVKLTEAELAVLDTNLQIELTWEKMAALIGSDVATLIEQTGTKPVGGS